MGMADNTTGEMVADPRVNTTHLEIRRVQNGFVIMAMDFSQTSFAREYREPQRASFVANDVEELVNVVRAIATGAEMNWLPTVDLPLVDMVRHSRLENLEKKLDAVLATKHKDDSNDYYAYGQVGVGQVAVPPMRPGQLGR